MDNRKNINAQNLRSTITLSTLCNDRRIKTYSDAINNIAQQRIIIQLLHSAILIYLNNRIVTGTNGKPIPRDKATRKKNAPRP